MKSFKISVLGESGVGKSSIVNRFVTDHFSEYKDSTVGAAFFTKILNIDSHMIKLEIWDTAGQERYHSLAPMYYRNSHAVIIVYNLTDYKSYEKAQMWVTEISNNYKDCSSLTHPLIYLVGNKLDLIASNLMLRKVSVEVLNKYANQNKLILFEVSAKTGHNIIELFHDIGFHFKELNQLNPSFENKPLYKLLSNTDDKINYKDVSRRCCGNN